MNLIFRLPGSLSIIFIGMTIFIFAQSLIAAPPVILTPDKGKYPLGPHLDILEDPTGLLSIDDVRESSLAEKFIRNHMEVPAFSFTKSAFWVRLQLSNLNTTQMDWLLVMSYPPMDHIEVYLVNQGGDYKRFESGDLIPFSQRLFKHHHFVFPLQVKPAEGQTILMRFVSNSSMQIPLTLWTPFAFSQQINEETFGFGIYYGIMFVMFFYNIFIFLSVRDKSYLFYVLYIGSYIIFQMSINGLAAEYLFMNSPFLADRSPPLFIGGIGLFGAMFSQSFLKLKNYSPSMHMVSIALMVTSIASALTALFGSYPIAIKISLVNAFLFVAIIFISGIICWRKGFRPARYFVIAWSLFLFGIFLYGSKTIGWLPSNFFTNYSVQIGSAFEVILLSLGLADRINILEHEKAEAQRKVLAAQRRSQHQLELILEDTKSMASTRSKLSAMLTAARTILLELPFTNKAEVEICFEDLQQNLLPLYAMTTCSRHDVITTTPQEKAEYQRERLSFLTKIPGNTQEILSSIQASGIVLREHTLWVLIQHQNRLQGYLRFMGINLEQFQTSNQHFVNALAQSLSIALDNINFHKEILAKMRMESELKTAAAVQNALFPKEVPQVKHCELATYFQPASETGGDWYGFVTEIPKTLYILIGDVTGHGTPAALITATASAVCRLLEHMYTIRYFIDQERPDPVTLMKHINRAIFDAGFPNYLMTFFIAALDLESGLLTYANAGHNFPYLVKSTGKFKSLLASGKRLGNSQEWEAVETSVQLEKGDLLVFYTDGLIENENPSGELWGERNLKKNIKENYALSPEELVKNTVQEAYRFFNQNPIQDDMSLVVLKVKEHF